MTPPVFDLYPSASRFGRALQKPRLSNPAFSTAVKVPAQKQPQPRLDPARDQGAGGREAGFVVHGTWERAGSRGDARRKSVVFLIDSISAKEVLLLGDFTDWQRKPIKLRQGAGSTWHTKVKLPPGRHLYRFLVDGRWHYNPNHARSGPNPFGSFDNVIEVSQAPQ